MQTKLREGTSAGRRARLSRERVLRAALSLADEAGIEALTMRRIGRRVGAEAMSLYRHVGSKDEILDGIVDIVFSEIPVPTGADWKPAMRQRAISAREALSRHPWAVGLMESRMQPGPANLRHHDKVLEVLREAGFSSATATHAYNLLDSYIFGFALQEQGLPFTTAEELAEVGSRLLEQIPAGEYPNLTAASSELLASGFNYADEFEVGLDLILDGIEKTWARP
ncbi:MAG: TetR/AcrR family transcriptional regulator [Candidatus Limnocylindria bacterium]